MSTKQIIGICLAVVVLIFDLWTDHRLEKKSDSEVNLNGFVNHIKGFWLRVIGLAFPVYATWWKLALVMLFAYWHLFDGVNNVWIKQNWFRIGTTSFIDKLQRKYPVITWLKYIGLAASITLLIILKN